MGCCRQLQRGVQALHEDRSKMQVSMEATGKRVAKLENALATSKDQVTALTNLVSGLISNDRDQVIKLLHKGVFSGTAANNAEAGSLSDKALPFEAPEHRAAAPPAGLASGEAGQVATVLRADAGAAEGGGAAPLAAEQVVAVANKGSTTVVGSGRDRGNLAVLSPGAGSPEGVVDRPTAAPIGSSLQPGQDALGMFHRLPALFLFTSSHPTNADGH